MEEPQEMKIIKRNGKSEDISFDKILKRVKNLGTQFKLSIPYSLLVMKVIDQLYNNISTELIDELTAQQCASMSTKHPDYSMLASAIVISNLHKKTDTSFYRAMKRLYDFHDVNNKKVPIVNDVFMSIVKTNKEFLDSTIDYSRDFSIDYFGFKTLERSYLLKVNAKIIERPQHMWMRAAICIHGDNMARVKETYDLMSQKYFTHATPTLFNAGTPRQQLSSCYLIAMQDDSIEGIFDTLKDCAKISKWAGGIGLHIHNIRATGSHIRGTNGISNGIVPMLSVFNKTARYVDQCIVPETYIFTAQGPKQIQHITLNDRIFNDTGKIEKIENILEHPYEGEIYNITTMHSIEPLKITAEHPVFVLYGQNKDLNNSLIRQRLENNKAGQFLEWKDVKDLTDNDMLAYSIPDYENDTSTISADDCYMYGIILGEGCMSNTAQTGHITLLSIENRNILDFCKSYFERKCVHYVVTINDNNTTIIHWNKNIVMPFRYSDIYNNNNEKYIAPRFLNLPMEKAKNIIKGLVDTDGCNKNEIEFENTSRILIEGLRYLLLRMSVLTSGENKKNSYILRIPKTQEICELLEMDINENNELTDLLKYTDTDTNKKYIFTRIKTISTSKYEGTLYDLQMPTNHNYMIHNGLIHNGGGKRNGSFAIYIEPHHADIEVFLDLKKNHGDEELRSRDLFYAVWASDLFMERVIANEIWSLFCPDSAPGLSELYGDEYKELYMKYENEKKYIRQVKARDIWVKILDAQMETGTPYLLYKDACNKKSNQKNLGTIKSSNLCTEVVQYSDKNETSVCNLASIGLSKFVKERPNPFKDVKIYTKPDCQWCNLLKSLLKKKDIKYDEFSITNTEHLESFKMEYNVIALPQLFDGDKLIGGYNICLDNLRATFDYEKLHEVVKIMTTNLNRIIDVNFYPTEKTKRSNLLHRPVGIGVQGLADVFMLMDYAFASDESKEINKLIFETIYHAALEMSCEISKERVSQIEYLKDEFNCSNWTFKDKSDICTEYKIYNTTCASSSKMKEIDEETKRALQEIRPINKEITKKRSKNHLGAYSSFEGSPASEGILQFDMWNVEPSSRYDWTILKENIKEHGLRNSLLVAPMPTASTSQILGNNECFEPYTSNIYTRRTLTGEFILVNKHLMRDLISLNMWTEDIKTNIIANKGSVQYIDGLPDIIKDKYKIVWEIPMKNLIDMSRDRGAFVCQSQSLNLWIEDPDVKTLTNMHFYSWKAGLKTGMYYLRRKPKHQPQQFTIEPEKQSAGQERASNANNEPCEMCSG
jgi:ribonucleotide reductase alpha subunit